MPTGSPLLDGEVKVPPMKDERIQILMFPLITFGLFVALLVILNLVTGGF